jgi:hypothetical protein
MLLCFSLASNFGIGSVICLLLSFQGCRATGEIYITSIRAGGGHANGANDMKLGYPFVYKHLGSMATIGRYKALRRS